MFHVLQHYIADETHKIHWKDLQVSDEGTFTVEPLRILDCKVRQLYSCHMDQVKVHWDKYSPIYATWEDVETMHRDFPSLS